MPQSTGEFFNRHLQMFATGDVEGMMTNFTDETFVLTPMGTIKGLDALRGFFTQVCKEFADPATVYTLNKKEVEGDVVYTTWSADTPANTYHFGSDTFLIRDEKVVAQTFAAYITPKTAT